MTSSTLQVESWPLERLIPYARNARTHSGSQVAEIAASISAFGFVNPVLVDPDGGIIAGHGRVLAARKLRLSTVPRRCSSPANGKHLGVGPPMGASCFTSRRGA
jgi:hypothetical protein